MSQKFIKNKEDFTCAHCAKEVIGDGYTNHCPYCLWSKHVDLHPGDRASSCGGLMEPMSLEKKKDGFLVVHRCLVCGEVKRNKTAPDDDIGSYLQAML